MPRISQCFTRFREGPHKCPLCVESTLGNLSAKSTSGFKDFCSPNGPWGPELSIVKLRKVPLIALIGTVPVHRVRPVSAQLGDKNWAAGALPLRLRWQPLLAARPRTLIGPALGLLPLLLPAAAGARPPPPPPRTRGRQPELSQQLDTATRAVQGSSQEGPY